MKPTKQQDSSLEEIEISKTKLEILLTNCEQAKKDKNYYGVYNKTFRHEEEEYARLYSYCSQDFYYVDQSFLSLFYFLVCFDD